jgi:hypothetical protein
MKITKKQRKVCRKLTIQASRVQKIEDFLIENADPVECPVNHYFTESNGNGLDMVCREYFMPAGTLITGTLYKIELFLVMVSGSMRMVEGDHTRDVVAPALLKNKVGQKNSWYAFEDCLIYGFWPNPDNSRDLDTVLNLFSSVPANELQGMPANKQQLNYQQRLLGQQNENQLAIN